MPRGKAISLNGTVQREPEWKAPEMLLCNDCFNVLKREIVGLNRIAARPWSESLECERCKVVYWRREVAA